jgi:hypothetical protein
MSPVVRVITMTYNHAAFIEAALALVFDQPGQPVDVVVVDNGSTDDTPRPRSAEGPGVVEDEEIFFADDFTPFAWSIAGLLTDGARGRQPGRSYSMPALQASLRQSFAEFSL